MTRGRPEHPITSYPRFGALRLLRSARRELAGEQNQADTSAPTNRIAAAPYGALSRWDVVDTGTLGEIHKIKYV